jgi:hypothetical protein
MGFRWLALSVAAAAAWLSPTPAIAAELRLEQPAPCTSVAELSFRVSQALGQPLERVHGPAFVVQVRQDARSFHARLEISAAGSSSSGLRQLDAASCEELNDALALAIAIALGSSASAAAPAAEDPTTPAPDSPPAQPHPPSDANITLRARNASPAPLHAALGAALIADTGSLPSAGFGAELGARLAGSLFELQARGLFLPARQAKIEPSDPASPGAELSLLAGALLGCVPLSHGVVQVAACAGAEVGQLAGRGTHVATPHERHALWSAARLDLTARKPLPGVPLALELGFTAAAPLLRDDFILKDIGTVHRPANVVGRAGLGLAWFFE